MAENDRIDFPEEVKEVKSNSVEEPAPDAEDSKIVVVEQSRPVGLPQIAMRNMIQAPGNCPPGYMMDAEGKCREVF
ncbi:hypothetical protein JYU34_007741 [Plutella xylostella]|uniref:Uncharacterized protein n=1 Tax=Plutella xylostella TaxID=51655 RepID=A0ABQ7QRB9_PLUXY|nr:hypothetical protein JYU34_007741 [Plutella xylostella]